MSCEMPKVPCLGPVPSLTEPVSPGDSGIVLEALERGFNVSPVLVEQKFIPPEWEKDHIAGECETWGNSTIIYLRANRKNIDPLDRSGAT